jgi:fluoride exporter
MRQILLVGAGGFIGAISRYVAGLFVLSRAAGWSFPLHTFLINVTGCFLAGISVGWLDKRAGAGDLRLFIVAGILGGYTTFSALGLDTVILLRSGAIGPALGNALGSVLAGVAAVWLGLRLAP